MKRATYHNWLYFLSILGIMLWSAMAKESHQAWVFAQVLGVVGLPIVARREVPTESKRWRRTAPLPSETEKPLEPVSRSGLTRALIVGAGAVGQSIAENLAKDGRYEVIGFVDDEIERLEGSSLPVLGGREETLQIVRDYDVGEVFLAYVPTWQQELAEELTEWHPTVKVQVVPSFYEMMLRSDRVGSMGDIALVELTTSVQQTSEVIKRIFDQSMALIMLVALAPLLAVSALLIRLTSAGPVIFQQERVGRHGKAFILYKFRTMWMDAESRTGPVLSDGSHDPRLTPVGRWLRILRIDEIPQLWNVLRGEMSIVGPRPERPWFVRQFESRNPIYARRHTVRPGITGLAQILGGYHTDARDKLRFDLYYITHQSLWMDLWILVRTLLLVTRSRGY